MLLGIDHLVVAVDDPDVAVEELSTALGVAPGGGGTHPSLGTRNQLIWLGDTFVEHYAATRDWEWRQWQDAVTDWELKRYFEII